MRVYDSIMTGLQEAIEYEEGRGTAKVVKISVAPLPDFSAEDIKEIRRSSGLTQKTFAAVLGVSVKTVEAWEAGTNKPIGSARRFLSVLKTEPGLLARANIISA